MEPESDPHKIHRLQYREPDDAAEALQSEPSDAQLMVALKSAVSDARVLAFVFVLLGVAGLTMGLSQRNNWEGQAFSFVCGVVLLAPGVLYLMAGMQLKKREAAGARLGLWAAAAHILAVPVLIVAGAFATGGNEPMMFIPAVFTMFFIPALIAFLFSMRKAQRIARQLGATGHGFSVLPAQHVLPVDRAGD